MTEDFVGQRDGQGEVRVKEQVQGQEDFHQYLQNTLEHNGVFLKYSIKNGKKAVWRRIWIEKFPTFALFYESKSGQKCIEIENILEIRACPDLTCLENYFNLFSFSIIYKSKGKYKTLQLMFKNKEIGEKWVIIRLYGSIPRLIFPCSSIVFLPYIVSHLNNLLDSEKPHDITMSAGFLSWVKEKWDSVDINSVGKLDLDQITVLMRKLNVLLSKRELKSNLKSDVAEIFSLRCISKKSYLTPEEFSDFILNVQKFRWTEKRIQETYIKFADPDNVEMQLDHFTSFLLSARNSIYRKDDTQDLSQPLSAYFVNSSHNTYLLGDQLVGDSSVEGYIRALQNGCRCLELDCWDGPAGEPQIFHGRTFTSKISFRSALEAIKKYAFVVSNSPLILSLEIHCSLDQQDIMAKIIIEIFGKELVAKRLDTAQEELPCPRELERQILLKSKFGEDDRDSDEEISNHTQRHSLLSFKSFPSFDSGNSPNSNSGEGTPKKTSRRFLSRKLSNLIVYFRNKPSKSIENTPTIESLEFNQMISLNDRRASALFQKSCPQFKALTDSRMMRVYPSILRVNSSNFDPIPHWCAGTQMVALNFQTRDRAMELNDALFQGYGNYGYVLKPRGDYLLEAKTLNVQVLSVQQIQHLGLYEQNKPEVSIEVIGHERDCSKKRTGPAKSTSINPQWTNEFQFRISNIEFSFLRFEISELEGAIGAQSIAGSFSIFLPTAEQGYKHYPLRSRHGGILGFLFTYILIE